MEKIKTLIVGLSITCVFSIISLSSCSVDVTSSTISFTTNETTSSDDSSTSQEIVERDYLPTITIGVSCDLSVIDYAYLIPFLAVFDCREDLINYFSVFPFYMRSNFYSDVDNFEGEYGFDNYLIVYFGVWTDASERVNAYINEVKNGNIDIVFEYSVFDAEATITSIEYLQRFYLIDMHSFEDQISSITLKIDEEILYSEDF